MSCPLLTTREHFHKTEIGHEQTFILNGAMNLKGINGAIICPFLVRTQGGVFFQGRFAGFYENLYPPFSVKFTIAGTFGNFPKSPGNLSV